MDSTKKYDKPSPEENANIINQLFYCWILPFFKYGYKTDLQTKDIYNTAEPDLSAKLGDELERNWESEIKMAQLNKRTPSLRRAIFKTFYKRYAFYGLCLFLQCIVLKMLQPVVLAKYVEFYEVPIENQDPMPGWLLGLGVVGLAFINVVVMHYATLNLTRIGMRVRIASCSLIYRKLLKLNRISTGEMASGQMVNLLSNDVQRFDLASPFLHYIWIMPIQAVIATYVMYNYIGVAAFLTILAVTIQAVPLQGYLSRLTGILRYKIAKLTDNRVKLMSEITSGIQVIKMYAWEKPFEKIVELARRYEINKITATSYIRGFSVALMVFTERATLYAAVITFVLLGNRLTSGVVFSMAQLLNTIQLYMSIFFPMAVSSYAEAKVSIKRIEEFLLLEENQHLAEIEPIKQNTGAIKLVKASASWIPNPIVDTLIDINVDIKPGTLCCVVGSVGAGKSSLLQLLLKELPLSTGKLEISGRVSYASQEPWLFVSSVRNNILFGQPYVRNRYKQVVQVCALERDFEQFPNGDKTLVGERGVSLSGGQRARINLARSVYRDTDIYLFDDPLSAVDTHVGKHLFEECIKKYLKGKTRILVTHQVQFLKEADLIIILNNGKIEKLGTFSELGENELSTLVQHGENKESTEKEKTPETEKRERLQSISSIASSLGAEEEPAETQELIEKGAIPTSTYIEYFRSGASIFTLIFLVFLLIIAQMASNASDLWVTFWTNQVDLEYQTSHRPKSNLTLDLTAVPANSTSNTTDDLTTEALFTTIAPLLSTLAPLQPLSQVLDNSFDNLTENFTTDENYNTETSAWTTNNYIYVYTIFILGSIVLTTARSLLFFKICMNASIALHNTMFNNVLKAPMRFFDTNPSGRILNRFSKDMGAVDELLPRTMLDALQIFLVMSGILVMNFIKTWWMMIPAAILGVLFVYFRFAYLATAQDVKRLEGTTKAPVFSHVSASLYGLPTIRSANAQKMIIGEFDTLQDQHTGTWFLFLATSESFGFYLDIISTAFLALVTFQFLIFRNADTLSGDVGLVISQSLILTGMLQFGVRQTAEVASNMTSVERVLQYTKLEQEGPFESLPTKKPPRDWPKSGRIVFKNTYLRYAPEEPPVLKNLNLEVGAGEKVGIVGRTGAGKSTLIASLFRLAPIDGMIEIDGVNTADIGLNDLRSNISIIPQEPVLFSATLRYNLDPFEKASDETLWKALENVELRNAVESLSQRVSEGGSNFSAGQRQLVCLARAIIRNNKVLVMDEATANVDPHTDSLIQKTIRKNFKDCTVLTIAHRLNTIMDSDKVLVMDSGQAVEFAHPHELLQNPNGYFTKMVRQTGPNMEGILRKVAQEDYKLKFPKNDEAKVNSTE